MKTPSALLSLAAVGLLASCAPAVTGPQLGRIVSGSTGEEGTVSIVRGTLRPIVADPFAPDNVTIEIGGPHADRGPPRHGFARRLGPERGRRR